MQLGPNHSAVNSGGKSARPFLDTVEPEFHPVSKVNTVSTTPTEVQNGVPSLFNPYSVVVFPALGNASNYNKIIDGGSAAPGAAGGNQFSPKFVDSIPTIANLVEDDELAMKTPYSYTDFLYCKYVGKIPNNQLVTLRRYPAPTYDDLAVPARMTGNPTDYYDKNGDLLKTPVVEDQPHFFPIAQAVTWFGEETENKLSELLSFTVSMNWKSIESEVNVVSGNQQGSEDFPLPGVAQFLGILTGQVNTLYATANSQYDPYNSGPYNHRVYGPVNVIAKTYKRDRGLDFKQNITLNFHYSLKSIGNINPKAAMLDLMSNILALTYNNAAFWGGANRYFPQKPTYPFLGGPNGMNAWYRGEPLTFAKSVGEQVSKAKGGLLDTLAKLANPASAMEELKKLADGAAALGMIQHGKGRAPALVAFKSLLTGEPVGEWHMVIGNPYKPIAKVGNLICTEAKFQFNDVIGADNFPTEMKVSITVEHGRPRDAGDIQSMFNDGQGRIYYPTKNLGDVLNATSSTKNSKNDTSWKGGGSDPYANRTSMKGLFTGSASEFDALLGQGRRIGKDSKDSATQAYKTADLMFHRAAGSGKKQESNT